MGDTKQTHVGLSLQSLGSPGTPVSPMMGKRREVRKADRGGGEPHFKRSRTCLACSSHLRLHVNKEVCYYFSR